jgi:hypothetical protein
MELFGGLATDYSRAFDVETAAIAFPRSANDVNAWSLRDTSCVWPAWIAASAPNPSYFSSNSQSGWSNASRRRWNGMGWNGSIVGRIPGRKCLFKCGAHRSTTIRFGHEAASRAINQIEFPRQLTRKHENPQLFLRTHARTDRLALFGSCRFHLEGYDKRVAVFQPDEVSSPRWQARPSFD